MKKLNENKIIRWIWIIGCAPLAIGLFMLLLVSLFARIPSFEELEHPDNKLATQVLSDDGQILTTFHIENRSYVSYDQLSPYLVQALVSTEDCRFYSHSGIDFKGLGRVMFKTILGGDRDQGGGSTVTQQLAKTLYPREETRSRIPGVHAIKMVWVKFREWITAVKLERNYTKDEIITMYFNSVFFGSNAYGIRAAARTFFDKLPSELTLEESAVLVGAVNAPTKYNPQIHPQRSKARRDFVLSQMKKEGYLSAAQLDSVSALPIVLHYQVQDHNAGKGPYFRDMLRRIMNAKEPKRSSYSQIEDYRVDSLQWANDPIYGWLNKNKKPDGSRYNLDRDGLRIYTTINYKMQQYAEEAVAEHLGKELQSVFWRDLSGKRNRPFANDTPRETIDRIMKQARRYSDRYRCQLAAGVPEDRILKSFSEKTSMRVFSWNKKGYVDTVMTPDDSIRYYKSHLRAAFMAIEPVSGHIKAYVGGPEYRYFKYDNIRQGKRQVGSTIKPFLYTLAMQEGLSPCTRVDNVPQTFYLPDGSVWTPRSTDKDEWIGNNVTLKWGLSKSSNNISAYLMKRFGPAPMVQLMHKMGVGSFIPEVPSICVGSAEVNVYEMVSAYNTFPSKGMYIEPLFVLKIEDNMGNVLTRCTSGRREAINPQIAYLMANLMQGVVDHGTAYRLRARYKLGGDIAGKTGTTNDNSDGWFIGYTPKLSAGVWVGGEDPQIHFQALALGGGSNMALPIWGIFMRKVVDDGTLGIRGDERFAVPGDIPFSLNCDGSEDDVDTGKKNEEEEFFF
ncbi:MAG: transglycosylase domain-containing protein [Bacteroidales bacterium]|nr:transglycosylase domain-containing protein [Bacteroidales bacterium]